MKSIALLTDGIFPYVIGGMQKHSYYLAKYFAENDIIVDLYHTNKSEKDIAKLELFSEKQKKNINSIVLEFPEARKYSGHYIRESYIYSERIFSEFIKRSPVDFIYIKGFTGWKLIEEKVKGMKFSKIGVNFHGLEMFQKQVGLRSRLESYLFKSPAKFNIQNSDYVFSYGGKITDILENLGVNKTKIIELSSGIGPEWVTDPSAAKTNYRKFVFIGRYERRKGIKELNIVLNSILKGHNFIFEFIGPIPEEKKIRSEKIIYHGVVTNQEEIKRILVNCDVLVCPSISEGMPNVILEAMSCGLALIATDVGAVSKMVDAKNGWLVKPGNTTDLKQKILDALMLPNYLIQQMKKHSMDKVQTEFRWDVLIKQVIRKVNETIKK